MPSDQNQTTPESLILEALTQYTLRSGHHLAVMTGLGPARLYPALVRLENEGKITSEWDAMPPPRRRRYRLKESTHA
jgi:DNA-binding PadR family transcriptional regulator